MALLTSREKGVERRGGDAHIGPALFSHGDLRAVGKSPHLTRSAALGAPISGGKARRAAKRFQIEGDRTSAVR